MRGRILCSVFMRDKTHPTVEETWSVGLCVMVRGALGGLCLLGVSGQCPLVRLVEGSTAVVS